MSASHDAAASMEPFAIATLERMLQARVAEYHEFLRVPTMSAGLYRIPQGGTDPQSPHSEDEVYYVVHGRARFHTAEGDRYVEPGTIIFVPARTAHRFHEIEEDLVVLVLFAPAERPGPP